MRKLWSIFAPLLVLALVALGVVWLREGLYPPIMPNGAGPLPGPLTVDGVSMALQEAPFTGITVSKAKDIWVFWWKLELVSAKFSGDPNPAWGLFVADVRNGQSLRPIDIVQRGMWTTQTSLTDFLRALAKESYRPASIQEVPIEIRAASDSTMVMWWEIMKQTRPTFIFIVTGAEMSSPCWVWDVMGTLCPESTDG